MMVEESIILRLTKNWIKRKTPVIARFQISDKYEEQHDPELITLVAALSNSKRVYDSQHSTGLELPAQISTFPAVLTAEIFVRSNPYDLSDDVTRSNEGIEIHLGRGKTVRVNWYTPNIIIVSNEEVPSPIGGKLIVNRVITKNAFAIILKDLEGKVLNDNFQYYFGEKFEDGFIEWYNRRLLRYIIRRAIECASNLKRETVPVLREMLKAIERLVNQLNLNNLTNEGSKKADTTNSAKKEETKDIKTILNEINETLRSNKIIRKEIVSKLKYIDQLISKSRRRNRHENIIIK